METGRLLFKEEVYRIIGAAMEVHKVMGPGFLEAVYQRCLAVECRRRGIPFVEQPRMELEYKGQSIDKVYIPDFLFFGEVVVEIKAIRQCGRVEEALVINGIRAAAKSLGVLINFGEPSLYWKRYANTRGKLASAG